MDLNLDKFRIQRYAILCLEGTCLPNHYSKERERYNMNIYSDAIEQLGIFTIVGGILAIVATVLAYVFIVPEKRREKLNAFGKFLHDTCNFKYLIVEKILQALYIFFTADMIILGFFMLFAAPKDYFGNRHWLGVYGILTMILGPIMIRLVYELLMMAVLLSKAAQPQNPQPQVPQSAPVAKFCGKCGSPLNEAGKCPNCDNDQPQA